MSRFPLKFEVISVRGQDVRVNELTSKRKGQWARAVAEDHYCAPYVLATLVCDPAPTLQEAEDWPADVIEQIAEVAQRLSAREGAEKNV